MIKLFIATLAFLIILSSAYSDEDMGTIRLNRLSERSNKASNRII